MRTRRRQPTSFLASVVLTLSLAVGCAPTTQPTPSDSAPTSTPAPIAFTLEVAPAISVGLTIPGAKSVFLVRVTGEAADGAVEVSATTSGATVSVEPSSLVPGEVGEVSLVPSATTGVEVPVAVDIRAERDGLAQSETRTITVQPGVDELRPEADAHLAPFLTWLAASRPELGITPDTDWEAVPGAWVLVVSHYLYFSSDWELDLAWHVMVTPDDWCRINLRRRWTQVSPSLAFEITSVALATPPHEIQPEDVVWR